MSIKFAARSSAKSKAKRLTKVTTGKVDASGWTQPHESKTPRMRRAYAGGGKVDKYVGEVEKEAGCKPRGDKRPRKMDGGPMTGPNDPRQVASNMMQQAASRAPVSGANDIPTFASGKQSMLRKGAGFEKGGKVTPKFAFKGDKKDDAKPEVKPQIAKKVLSKTPAGTAYPQVPKKLPLSGNNAIMPDTDGGPAFKKGGCVPKKGFGGALGLIPELISGGIGGDDDKKKAGVTPPSPALKKGGRACKAGGGATTRGNDTYTSKASQERTEAAADADQDNVGKADADADDQFAARVEAGKALAGRKAGGRTERKAGGRVKGKTNINIIIAPGAGGGEHPAGPPAMGAPGMKPPGMPPMPPAPPAGGPPGAPPAGGGAPSPLAGLPPQLIAAAMGGGGAGASMPPSGPPRLPMRAAGGRLVREVAGAGSGEGRLEKTHEAAKRGQKGL